MVRSIYGWFARAVVMCVLCIALSMVFGVCAEGNELRIAVASDLHMQEPDPKRVEANQLMYYQNEILSAFTDDIAESGADILLLTGDLANNGRRAEHELLTDVLRRIEANGVRVYVLPGNHDVRDITPEQFAEIYADFGYDAAFSRDDNSLSYSILIQNRLILMLDTNGYTGDRMTAYLYGPTLRWMRQQLSVARDHGYGVLAAGHYPLVTQQTTPVLGKEEAVSLLREYNVPLYVCGHMHLRDVARSEALTELIADQIVSAPCAYAMITMGEAGIEYLPRKIDIARWAADSGSKDDHLLRFDDYIFELTDAAIAYTIDSLIGGQEISERKKKQMSDFFTLFRHGLIDGSLYRNRAILEKHPGYGVFMQYAGNSTWGRWIPTVFENLLPYTNGFVLKNDGTIREYTE